MITRDKSVRETMRVLIIAAVESALCFFGWVIIFWLGADHPVPFGFWKLVVLVAVLSVMQFVYVRWLLMQLLNCMRAVEPDAHYSSLRLLLRPLLWRNVLSFATVSMLTAALTGWQNHMDFIGIASVLWVLVVTGVGLVYGSVLWAVNRRIAAMMLRRSGSLSQS